MAASPTAFVHADSSGDLTFDGQSAVAAYGQDATNWASSQANDPNINAALSTAIGLVTAAVIAGEVVTGVALTAAIASTGPFAPVTAAVIGAEEALIAADPAHGGPGGVYDCKGNWHQAGAKDDWKTFALQYGCLAAQGISPSYYNVPNPEAAHENGAPTVGFGPRPGWTAGSFEDTADKLLVADYMATVNLPNVLAGKFYNWARFPAILALAQWSWNQSHSGAGAARSGAFGITIQGSGGTRPVSVLAAEQPAAFGYAAGAGGVQPSSTDSVSLALWLSQYSAAEWKAGKAAFGPSAQLGPSSLKARDSISIVINNGAAVAAAAPARGLHAVRTPAAAASASPDTYVLAWTPPANIAQIAAAVLARSKAAQAAANPAQPAWLSRLESAVRRFL